MCDGCSFGAENGAALEGRFSLHLGTCYLPISHRQRFFCFSSLLSLFFLPVRETQTEQVPSSSFHGLAIRASAAIVLVFSRFLILFAKVFIAVFRSSRSLGFCGRSNRLCRISILHSFSCHFAAAFCLLLRSLNSHRRKLLSPPRSLKNNCILKRIKKSVLSCCCFL